MVRKHLRFYPRWFLEEMVLKRGDLLWLYEILTQQQTKILGILLGLNRLYYSGSFKRLDRLIARMEIAPLDLSTRLKRIRVL